MTDSSSGRVLLSQFIDDYRAALVAAGRKSASVDAGIALQDFARFLTGDPRTDRITKRKANAYLIDLEKKVGDSRKLRKYRSILKVAFDWARDEGKVSENPFLRKPPGIGKSKVKEILRCPQGVIDRLIRHGVLKPIDGTSGKRYEQLRFSPENVEEAKSLLDADKGGGEFSTPQGTARTIRLHAIKSGFSEGFLESCVKNPSPFAKALKSVMPDGHLPWSFWPPYATTLFNSRNPGTSSQQDSDSESQKVAEDMDDAQSRTDQFFGRRIILVSVINDLKKAVEAAIKVIEVAKKKKWVTRSELYEARGYGIPSDEASDLSACISCWVECGKLQEACGLSLHDRECAAKWELAEDGSGKRNPKGKTKFHKYRLDRYYDPKAVRKLEKAPLVENAKPIFLSLFDEDGECDVASAQASMRQEGVVGKRLVELLETCNVHRRSARRKPHTYILKETPPPKLTRIPLSEVVNWLRQYMSDTPIDGRWYRTVVEAARQKDYPDSSVWDAKKVLKLRKTPNGKGKGSKHYLLNPGERIPERLMLRSRPQHDAGGRRAIEWSVREAELAMVEEWERFRAECSALPKPVRPRYGDFCERTNRCGEELDISARINSHYAWEVQLLAEWKGGEVDKDALISRRCPGMPRSGFDRVIARAAQRKRER